MKVRCDHGDTCILKTDCAAAKKGGIEKYLAIRTCEWFYKWGRLVPVMSRKRKVRKAGGRK